MLPRSASGQGNSLEDYITIERGDFWASVNGCDAHSGLTVGINMSSYSQNACTASSLA